MRILFVSIRYPDVSKNSTMYSALVEALVSKGHEVRVIAPEHGIVETHVVKESHVPVLRVKIGPLFTKNLLVKGLNMVRLNSLYSNAIRQYWNDWRVDWIITYTPPITLAPFLGRLKARYNAGIYLILRDIFPQNAKDLGMINNPLIFSYFRYRERSLYKISDIIGCMSLGNIEFLHKQDPKICSMDKLTYFPNWISPTNVKKQDKKRNRFRKSFNFEGKFIALFGGNFGKPQKVDFVLDLANRVQKHQDVIFCLIGDGTHKERIRYAVKHRELSNVFVFDRLPREEYQSIIQDADIGLVNLSDRFTIPNIPSRTLGYWDASLPVLAATDLCTDLNKNFLKKYNGGLWAMTGSLEQYYDQFMKLYNDKNLRKKMGENGRKAVETDFSVNQAVCRFLEQINQA